MKKEYIKPESQEYVCHPLETYLSITSLPVIDPEEPEEDEEIEENW